MKITKCAKKWEREETTKTTTKARKFQNGNEQSQKITIGISFRYFVELWRFDFVSCDAMWCDVMWFKHLWKKKLKIDYSIFIIFEISKKKQQQQRIAQCNESIK